MVSLRGLRRPAMPGCPTRNPLRPGADVSSRVRRHTEAGNESCLQKHRPDAWESQGLELIPQPQPVPLQRGTQGAGNRGPPQSQAGRELGGAASALCRAQAGRAGLRAFWAKGILDLSLAPPELPGVFLLWVGCPGVADLLTSGAVRKAGPVSARKTAALLVSPALRQASATGREGNPAFLRCLPSTRPVARHPAREHHNTTGERDTRQRLPEPSECQLCGYF